MHFTLIKLSGHWPQWLAGFTVSLGVLVTGFASGCTSPLIAQLTAPNNTLPLRLTDGEASWFASLINLGRLTGAIIGANSQGLVGRKKTMLWGGVPMAAGWLCTIAATSVPWLYVARLLCGVASGMIWSGLSLFLGEIADPTIRGSLIFLNLNITAIGGFLGIVMGPYLSMRMLGCVSLAGTASFIVLFSLVPDSPYHHTTNGDYVNAEKSIKWYNRKANVKLEIQQLRDFVGTTNVGFVDVFRELKKNREHVKNLSMLMGLNVFLYCSGHNTMGYYAEIIVTKIGVETTPSSVVIALSFSTIVAGSTAILVVDKFGRRSLLIVSASVTSISLVLLGVHFHVIEKGRDADSANWLPILALFMYNFGSYYGIVPVPNALVSELFPPNLKTFASTMYSSVSAIMAFVVAKSFQPYVDVAGEKYVFWSFAVSAIGSAIFTYLAVPETRGKTLVEIQRSMTKNEGHREVARSVTKTTDVKIRENA